MESCQTASQPGRRRIATWLYRHRLGRLLLTIALLVAAGAIAQVVAPTPAPTYCSPLGCFDTLDKAETAMRAQTAYGGAGPLLEHMATAQMSATTLRMQY